MVVDANTELRKLQPAELYNLGLILNSSDNWKRLMALVTKEENDNVPKFPGEHIAIVEQAARQERKLAAAIFLEEWGTMGRKRPTLGLLLDLLMKAQLFRAADYLAEDILKVESPKRPTSGPAALIDIDSIAEFLDQQNLDDESVSNDSSFCLQTTRPEISLNQINYPTSIFDGETATNDDNLSVDDNEVGFFEMEYAESRSNQALDHARVPKRDPQWSMVSEKKMQNLERSIDTKSSNDPRISDLMKFSSTAESHCGDRMKGFSHSDLMKFDSRVDPTNENAETSFIPDLNILRPTLTTRGDQDSPADWEILENSDSRNYDAKSEDREISTNREMRSTEFPACLGNFASGPPDASYFHRELRSSELPLCINDRTGFGTTESSFHGNSTFDADDYSYEENSTTVTDRSAKSTTSISRNSDLQGPDPETDLPCFVVEAGTRRMKNEENEESTVEDAEKKVLNSQELPVTVLEFHKR